MNRIRVHGVVGARRFACVLMLLLLGAASSASAEIGALDPVPSATLLFPYFEADTKNASGVDTLLVVENSAGDAQLAHVVVWSDRGVPVLDFDLYLTAHGRERISMRSLTSGKLPTSAAGSAQAGCNFPLTALASGAVADLRAALTGKHMPSVNDATLGCPGHDHGDHIARGYVTVDTVSACSSGEVTAGTYWSSRLSTSNTLLGSFSILQGKDKPAYAEQALHIEASDTDSRTADDGDATFYGRFVDYTAADHRERLPVQWSTQVLAARSDLVVWRETKRTLTDATAVGCDAAARAELNLSHGALHYFSESEEITEHDWENDAFPFVHASGRYAVGGSEGLPMPYRAGMIHTNLSFGDASDPASVAGLAQSAVLSMRSLDALGTANDGALALGTPLDDGFEKFAVNAIPATSDFGPNASLRPRAMLDNRAAASLVLPYFEVSLEDPNAAQTQLSIVNPSATARLAKVSLFTDHGIPTESFLVYLTGYDIATIDLRVLFATGLSARTASAGQDPQDTISPQGPFSQDINFASCYGALPATGTLSEAKVSLLRAAHTGQPVSEWDDKCGGRALDDEIARGYIVIDEQTSCSLGPVTAATLSSQAGSDGLSGSFTVRSRAGEFSYGAPLVSLHEVSAELSAGDMTFWGWLDNWAVSGNYRREGLPNAWRVPFVNGGSTGSTELVFFRPVHRTPVPYACDATPAALTAGLVSIVAHDGADDSTAITGFSPGFVAGRIPLGAGGLDVPYEDGALELDLNFQEDENAPGNPSSHMGFVGAVHRPAGSSDSVFVQGFPLHLAGEP